MSKSNVDGNQRNRLWSRFQGLDQMHDFKYAERKSVRVGHTKFTIQILVPEERIVTAAPRSRMSETWPASLRQQK